MSISPAALREIHELHTEASQLLAKRDLTRADSKRADLLIAKIASIKQVGLSGDEIRQSLAVGLAEQLGLPRPNFSKSDSPDQHAHEQLFKRFLRGVPDTTLDIEVRGNDFLAGSETVSWAAGNLGGVVVPQSFSKNVAEGLAAVDPLLDDNVVSVIHEPGLKLPPLELPGWDLSTIKAVQVAEAAQHASDAVPPTTQKVLNKFTYRLSLGASLEWEDDQKVFESSTAAMARAFGVGFARGIGADLVVGNGSTAPSGILNGLASAYTTTAAGAISALDIEAVYFKVNRIYRASKKCAWLMTDSAYQLIRKSADSSLRPLIDIVDDEEMLMGKPIYICPSLPITTGSAGSFCCFGDLSSFYVHVTSLYLRRRLQVPGYVENGKALFTGLMSVDSILHDPTAGVMPPVVVATLHV